MRHMLPLILLLCLPSCVPCGDDIDLGDLCVPGACLPPEPAEIYGPCEQGACNGSCLSTPSGDVCTDVGCGQDQDCDQCSPGGAKVRCVAGQCLVPCTLTNNHCPEGMVCDDPTNVCVWPMK